MTSPHIFGPVASGRLGRSLGLDLLGARVCSYDCLYCEVGRTASLTLARAPYVRANTFARELRAWAKDNPELPALLDHLTLGGSGEPCLNSELGDIILAAREALPGIPVAVLTNASLLGDPAVRGELALADAVLPSMDTLVPEEFRRLNRPHPDLDLQGIARGLLAFRAEYTGQLYLEILLCQGVNDSAENLEQLRAYCRALLPDRVDVVTLSRPGAYPAARAVDPEMLAVWRAAFSDDLGRYAKEAPTPSASAPPRGRDLDPARLALALTQSLRRRPQTAAELALALARPEEAVAEALETLRKQGHIHLDRGMESSAACTPGVDSRNVFFRVGRTDEAQALEDERD